ncbi:MAG: nucleotidyltransferase family protein [Bacteroidales bacterium]|nr:nucleotidyltransferase family protein [Bacteroidales bacterium]
MITESPVYEENGVIVPELEKLLVDKDSDREYASLDDTFIQKEFQRAFELYPVNTSRLLRYAGRKGKKEEILSRINRINQERVAIVRNIQNYFQQEPVERAWLFGSFSRMEESPDSDIDILVSFDKEAKVSLFDHLGMKNDLQDLLGRDVDLVTEGTFLPYIANTADNDKVLIYERVS